ncbi:MAG: hypothetical protein QME41_10310 [Actinomycetota bacterium]|nr:hypothetical protein [Actinomycetota bacterium]
MYRIRIDEIINQLHASIQASLKEAVEEVLPEAKFDEHRLFDAFKHSVARRCRRWERVSDRYVELD